jgi:hypothetical protein
VRQAVKDHPQLKKEALFINAATDSWPETADILSHMSVDETEISEIGKTVRTARRLKTSFCQAVEDERRKTLSAVVFHPEKRPLYAPQPGLKDDVGTFDHETAHALVPSEGGPLSENTADAFAVLRHLQRFGETDKDIDYCGWKRAVDFMRTGVTSHLTTFTVDKILLDKKSADFLSLSPAETAAIARDYARRNTLKSAPLKKLVKDFRPLRKLPPREAFKRLATITMKAPPDSETFYLGARILQGALWRPEFMIDGKKVSLPEQERERLSAQLSKKLGKLPKDHPLRRAA